MSAVVTFAARALVLYCGRVARVESVDPQRGVLVRWVPGQDFGPGEGQYAHPDRLEAVTVEELLDERAQAYMVLQAPDATTGMTIRACENIKRLTLVTDHILYAAEQEKPGRHLACCPQAVRKDCVCEVRWSCPRHGTRCHGSHD